MMVPSAGPVLPPAFSRVPRLLWPLGQSSAGKRAVPEETAVALTYNRVTHAVMMATPTNLEDFAVGFSLAEGVVESAADIDELEVRSAGNGIELRMWIGADRLDSLLERRRTLAGPTGCGLCGLESLEQATRLPSPVTSTLLVQPTELQSALATLSALQPLNQVTRAAHAAGFWRPTDGTVLVREDVGRHNALDKLAGALARAGRGGTDGVLLLTSRVSVELVQKAATLGVSIMAAVSAPTALAIRTAQHANITLVGVARQDGFEVFTHPDRLLPG